MKQPSPTLVDYIEAEIIPRYAAFDPAHRTDHVRTVIAESLRLAERCDADADMVYAVAAYHDAGLADGRVRHHLRSAEILRTDQNLSRWFSEAQIARMAEAVEDHRASAEHAPRTRYGRIVAEADRCLDPVTVVRRTVQYGLANHSEPGRDALFERCLKHLTEKYAAGGYLRLWIPESNNARRLEELRYLIRDQKRLRRLFDTLCDELAAERE